MVTTLLAMTGQAWGQDDASRLDLGWLEQLVDAEATPQPASDWSYELSLFAALNLEGGLPETSLLLDPDTESWSIDRLLRPRRDLVYPTGGVAVAIYWDPVRWFSLRTLLDSGELRDGTTLSPPIEELVSSGNPVEDELGSAGFVRELAVLLAVDPVQVQVGRFRSSVGHGLVYDAYGTGVEGGVDLSLADLCPLRLQLQAVAVGRELDDLAEPNPLIAARGDWDLSLFESIGVFAAVFFDRDGELSEVMRSAYAERIIVSYGPYLTQLQLDRVFLLREGRGTIFYGGAEVVFNPAPGLSVRGAFVLSSGVFSLRLAESERREVDLSGWAADLELHCDLADRVELGAFAVALSGSEPPSATHTSYSAFIGIAPYWAWTGLFFSGGINQSLLEGRAAAAGINGHGVIGGGPTLQLDLAPALIELRAAWLGALVAPPARLDASGSSYGIETDLLAEIALLSWLSLQIELGLLFPISFFPSSRVAYRGYTLFTVIHDG